MVLFFVLILDDYTARAIWGPATSDLSDPQVSVPSDYYWIQNDHSSAAKRQSSKWADCLNTLLIGGSRSA